MSLHRFLAEIRGAEIHCSITSDGLLDAPVFCFSLMAPPEVVSGGSLIRTDGGYGEVQLPDIKAGMTHHFILRYANPTYKPKNRAWLPLGAYLRAEDFVDFKASCRRYNPGTGACPQVKDLCLVPKPYSWTASGGYLPVRSVKQKSPLWHSVDALALRCNLPSLQDDRGVLTTLDKDETISTDGYRIEITPEGLNVRYGAEQGALCRYNGIVATRNARISRGVMRSQGLNGAVSTWIARAFLQSWLDQQAYRCDGIAEDESLSLALFR